MTVNPATTKHHAMHAQHAYYFCSAGCRAKFVAEPSRCLDERRATTAASAVDAGAMYTCPMHAEIKHVGPARVPNVAWHSSP